MRSSSRPGSVTLRSVAERAGVSAMTVSNVINGKGRVGRDTIDRVKAVIGELGYVPNIAARQLVGARSAKIGLIYADHRTPFLDAILVAALEATTARGLQLVARGGKRLNRQEAKELATDLVGAGADALLLVPPFAELLSGTSDLAGLGIPTAGIATGRGLPDMATVRIDNRAAMRAITQLLLDRGHRRIGCVSGPFAHGDSRERLAGFREAFEEAGAAFSEDLVVDGNFTFQSGVLGAEILLEDPDPPTAIVASNDDMAAGVIAEAQRRGLRLPDQLAVTGFDDTSIAARIWPRLTVARQPIREMTARAMEILLDALDGKLIAGGTDELLPHEIIERESTSAPPAS